MYRRAPVLFVAVLTVCLSTIPVLGAMAQGPDRSAPAVQEIVQQTCPVMKGNKIDPNIYTDYQGKRVYFCCQKCKAAFEANPEEYLGRLPQFEAAEGESGEGTGFHPGEYIEALGLTTLSLLIVTFCFGFFMKRNPKVLHKWHKRLAYVTLIVALSHAGLVMIVHNL